jgi:hypothetical protein
MGNEQCRGARPPRSEAYGFSATPHAGGTPATPPPYRIKKALPTNAGKA